MLSFTKAAAIKFGSNYITDHNRAEIDISTERIEKSKRMANGTMRKYVVADKRTFSFSWNNLPGSSTYTVDGAWGLVEMKSFYAATKGAFNMTVTYADASTEVVTVMFSKFDHQLTARGRYDMYTLSISVEEV